MTDFSDLEFNIPLSSPSLPVKNTVAQIIEEPYVAQHHYDLCVLHLTFKTLAIVIYFIYGMFSSQNNLIFIFVTIFGAFDFWVVKNITGRYSFKKTQS